MYVLWDGDCGFCAWTLSLILRADARRQLRPATIQGPVGERLLAGMPEAQRLASWHLVDDEGRVTSGGAALPLLFRDLPAGAPLAAVAGALPAVTDRAYGWVGTHRRLLSKPIPASSKGRARRLIERRS